MKKLNIFQDILHFSVHSLSSALAASMRPFITVSCLFLCFFVFTTLFSSSVEPILNSGLLSGLALITLLLVSYLSLMININPARQKMAFFLTRVGAPYGYSYRAEARYTKRCRAPFFRFR
ncbi:putative transmembrane protein [Marinomonas primoryensis]|jgi:hypothetical protein|uniref:Putative transmembrane protein n=1 Tax=Marinomonas primoryensis TaxID=178399 RepID=A0A859CWB4_9GAMM|nr:putative transmembrane protein [Marinomonas primoryensis]